MTDRPLAAVTGGTGFLGQYVARELAARGWRVRLLVRGQPLAAFADLPVETRRGDLADIPALRSLVAGAQAVVHLAGVTKARGRAEFLSVNRDGAARLAAATAGAAPEARFVHVSSLAARAPDLSAYAASKRAGEAAIAVELGAAARWVVLRPSVIYGPGDREGRALYRLASAGIVPAPRAPEPRIALVHAEDVAGAVVTLCRSGPSAACFEVTDACPDGYGYREFLTMIGAARGRRPRFLGVPDPVLLAAGVAADAWSSVTGRPRVFGRGKVRELLHRDWTSSPGQQLPRPVWSPRIGLREGLPATVAWWASLDRRQAEGNRPGMARLRFPALGHVLPRASDGSGALRPRPGRPGAE